MATQKKAFVFERPLRQKLYNNVGRQGVLACILSLGLLVMAAPLMVKGRQNSKMLETKEAWLRKRVMDPNADEFDKLDAEAPPINVKPLTELDKFRLEFAKIREKDR